MLDKILCYEYNKLQKNRLAVLFRKSTKCKQIQYKLKLISEKSRFFLKVLVGVNVILKLHTVSIHKHLQICHL